MQARIPCPREDEQTRLHLFSTVAIMQAMNRAAPEIRARVLHSLCEGVSIRATARLIGVSNNLVMRLLHAAGPVCAAYQDEKLRNLPCTRIEIGEVWGFTYCKQKNLENAKSAPRGAGTVWLWLALDVDTKPVPSWLIGGRELDTATEFAMDLRSRLAVPRVQLTSDGHSPYRKAVDRAFGRDVDFAMLEKQYEGQRGKRSGLYRGSEATIVSGSPDLDRVSTSYIERFNLTVRTTNKMYSRKTNAFSKKLLNHSKMVALSLFSYNFCRGHTTLKKATPAQAAGVDSRRWTFLDLVELIDERTPLPNRPKTYRKPYRKRTRAPGPVR